MTSLNPYLSFRDNARDAMEFYQSVFGGELTVSTFADFPGQNDDASEDHLVMHSQLTTPDGLVLMGSDTPSRMGFEEPAGFSVSVSGDDEAELERYWNGLVAGGTVVVPFEVPPWGGRFGMLTDRFGVDWMVALNDADQP